MSWKTGIHARFLILSALLSIASPATFGENIAGFERVTSVVPDLSHGSITISTNSKSPLPAPLIQYLPGPDGKTLLVADFEGVSYQLPTHLLKPESLAADAWRQKGIQEIRIGQFSSQPPTMRISVGAFTPRAFKTLAFHARPGALIMKWTPGYPSSTPQTSPPSAIESENRVDSKPARVRAIAAGPSAPVEVAPVAPSFRKPAEPINSYSTTSSGRGIKEVSVRSVKQPVTAPPVQIEKTADKQLERSKWVASADSDSVGLRRTREKGPVLYKSTGKDVSVSETLPSTAVPPIKSENLTDASEWADRNNVQSAQISVSLNDVDQLKDNGSTDVLVKTDRKLNYKTFRLHEPERYVIDFDGLPGLDTTQLPPVTDELLVKGMRTGTPDDTGLTQRLVLDLKDNTVDVSDSLLENGTALSLRIRPSSSIPMPPQLKAGLVRDKLIVLDAGHGGSDPGAQRSGIQEKELTMQITNQLKKRLTQLGARVVMTRSDDTFVSLEDRVKITNETQPDLFVSIHINALESTNSIYGVETYYQTEQSKPLAAAIHQQLVSGLGVPDRFVRKARFYVINHTAVPAILAEVGFISNPKERDNLGSAEYQVKIADSVSSGIVQFLTEKQELAGKTTKPSF